MNHHYMYFYRIIASVKDINQAISIKLPVSDTEGVVSGESVIVSLSSISSTIVLVGSVNGFSGMGISYPGAVGLIKVDVLVVVTAAVVVVL